MSAGVYGAITALREIEEERKEREILLERFDSLTPDEKIASGREILDKILRTYYLRKPEKEVSAGAFFAGWLTGLAMGWFFSR